ncbi:MAG: argininosuccinate lyase [Nitrospinota bacterium]
MARKPWAGRFRKGSSPSAEAFTQSISFDRRLAPYDIRGSIAHARMLSRIGVITKSEGEKLVRGLKAIGREIEGGKFPFDETLEDVHMNVEARLAQKIGATGAKLHTGRSRNDQVSLDLRLYLKEEIAEALKGIDALREVLLDLAEAHLDLVMPGYTHLQRAQPVRFSHHLLAYCQMLLRDRERFEACLKRTDVLPLGSGALAGSGFPVDRAFLAKELGFGAMSENSIDAVSDRDFAVEFCSCASLLMMHLSRLAEDLILWATREFSFVELPEEFCTGSSMLPQKKNPDVAELVRGKTGRVYGHLMGLLTLMKGLPLSYNRDLQEDKEAIFDTADTVRASLGVMAGMLRGMKPKREAMEGATAGFLLAVDLADYLVGKGLPFREAHGVVGRVVAHCLETGKELEGLELKELKGFSPAFEADFKEALDLRRSLERKSAPGGTSKRSVLAQIRRERKRLRRG